MRRSYEGLLAGLGFAIVLVYLLIVVNFQSWLDPFIIITALPAALAGIVIFLFIYAYHAERPRADGRHHVHGRRHREQHSGDRFAKDHLQAMATRYAPRSRPASRVSVRC